MRPPMSAPPLFIFDGHTDVPTRLWESPCDLRQPCADRHVDLPRLRSGGVSGLVCALFVPASLSAEEGLAHAEKLHGLTVEQLEPGGLELAGTPEELDAVVARGGVGVVLGLENGRPLSIPGA